MANNNERIHQLTFGKGTEEGDTSKLQKAMYQVAEIADEVGLRPFTTHFEMVPAHIMYEFGAYGVPGAFSHWTKGREYFKMKATYDYGLSKIYELVINTDPSLAFLLDKNTVLQNTLVMAHVLGHVDFFAHNAAFGKTNRKMLDKANLDAQRIEEYKFKYGEDEVEKTLDAILSIEMNVDHEDSARPGADEYVANSRREWRESQKKKDKPETKYDDVWEIGVPRKETEEKPDPFRFPFSEERDLLYMIANFSPTLEDWQKDCCNIVRETMLYFIPLMKTKIMNEGWASFWHRKILRIMSDRGQLDTRNVVDYAALHSGVASPGSKGNFNPYHVGLEIWTDIERRSLGIVDPDAPKTKKWYGEKVSEGSLAETIWDVREMIKTDQDFMANYLTPRLIKELELYNYEQVGDKLVIADRDPDNIKRRLYDEYVNLGRPVINIVPGGADWNSSRELYLKHSRDRLDLDRGFADNTLKAIYYLWGRPVHLETQTETNRVFLSCNDGENISQDGRALISG